MKDAAERLPQEPITARIARRVRTLRDESHLSLEELAQQSGVSRSMLSLIERGESSPTAVVLDKIAAGLGVSLAVFFADPAARAQPLSRAGERPCWRDPQTGYLREVLSPVGFAAPLQLVQVTLPAGRTVHYEGIHRVRPYHQQIWLLEGRMTVSAGTDTYELEEGDCLALEVDGRATSFSNPSRRRARYAVVIAVT